MLRAIASYVAATLAIAAWADVLAAPAPDEPLGFRMENRVFLEGRKAPELQTTTLFHGETAYDYLESPAEVTVFDKPGNRFILLDTAHRTRAEISFREIEDFMAQLQDKARSLTDPYLRFLADPKFDERTLSESEELEFASPFVTYRLKVREPEDRRIVDRYREFSDWYGKLNTLLNPGSRPPFARLAVNGKLADRGQIPREVQLTLKPRGKILVRKIQIRSEHQFLGQLIEADRNRIAQTDQFITMFVPVSFAEYQQRIRE